MDLVPAMAGVHEMGKCLDTEGIASAFKERLGAGVDVDVRLVDAIPTERSGKYRYVISHVAPEATPKA